MGIKEVCDELGIRLIAYSPLGLGMLTGKYGPDGPYPKGLRGLVFRQLLPGMRPLLETLGEIATHRNKTPAQVAINWCICKGTIPIPGCEIPQAGRAKTAGAMGWSLDSGEVEELDKAAQNSDKTMVQNIFQSR